uniref:Ig-like domain-containing protein n=1 Tax=Gadus morhua TaxID=8049 RepID=A0A8C5CKJ1_GADMO
MGPLLLLFSCWTLVGAQTPLFKLRSVTLTIEPATDLLRDANATLWCRAGVSSSGTLTHVPVYTFYKDGTKVFTKKSASSELAYPLLHVRYSNTGKYKCRVEIDGQGENSDTSKLTVTGVSVPLLQLSRSTLSEGEELTASCSAPDETGAFFFYFYVDGREMQDQPARSNRADAQLRFNGGGVRQVHCDYTVMLAPGSTKSNKSNTVTVSVRELSFRPLLEIRPVAEVFEGDQLSVSCRPEGNSNIPGGLLLLLTHGTQLLGSGVDHVNSSITAKESGEIECSFEVGNVPKKATKNISVIELFSVPRLSVSLAEVFAGDRMVLTCSSAVLVARRLTSEDISYALDSKGPPTTELGAGRFSVRAPPHPLSYTCTATARGITKHSQALLVRPKVSVVRPSITVVEQVILGRPFQIRCLSEGGSLPINYTLFRKYEPLNVTTVSTPYQQALFTATIQESDDIKLYMCEAANKPNNEGELSPRLNASVIVPLSNATLTALPAPWDVSEGDALILICGVTGTPPVTFKWYRKDGGAQLLFAGTANGRSMAHRIHAVSRDHSGSYYCEAVNHARNPVRSQTVLIEGELPVGVFYDTWRHPRPSVRLSVQVCQPSCLALSRCLSRSLLISLSRAVSLALSLLPLYFPLLSCCLSLSLAASLCLSSLSMSLLSLSCCLSCCLSLSPLSLSCFLSLSLSPSPLYLAVSLSLFLSAPWEGNEAGSGS